MPRVSDFLKLGLFSLDPCKSLEEPRAKRVFCLQKLPSVLGFSEEHIETVDRVMKKAGDDDSRLICTRHNSLSSFRPLKTLETCTNLSVDFIELSSFASCIHWWLRRNSSYYKDINYISVFGKRDSSAVVMAFTDTFIYIIETEVTTHKI